MRNLPTFKATGNNTFKLGVMGGTFDPIHNGHLMIAEQVADEFALDAVLFMPAGIPHFKQGQLGASPEARYEMTILATSENPRFFVSNAEIERPGVTYTADTLRFLHEYYGPHIELFFITGADAMATFPTWKDAEQIAKDAHLIATSRFGYSTDVAKSAIENSGITCNICFKEVPELAISSTDIRNRLKAHKTVRYLLPSSVLDYIEKNHLYQEEQQSNE